MPSPRSCRRLVPLALVAFATACGDPPPRDPEAPLSVVASVEPLAMLVRELAGEESRVHTLLPAGASPHLFSPRPSDLRAVARADWVLRVGGPFDAWAHELLALGAADPPVTELLALPGLDPLPLAHDHDHAAGHVARGGPASLDPHCWLDPIRVREVVVPALRDTLVALDPARADRYREAAERFRHRLETLDAELRALFAPPEPAFLSLHAAWGYLAARYHLDSLGVVEVVPGEAPSPRHLAALIRASREDSGRVLLVEPLHHTSAARVAAQALRAELRLVDPLGDPNAAERADYASLMRFNARAIASAGGRGARTGD